MDGQLVGEIPALGDLDRIDLADEVGDSDIRRGQLLGVALGAANPLDDRLVALVADELAGILGDRGVGVVVDLAALDDGDFFVQQVDHRADEAGLGLAPLAEEDQVMARQNGVLDLGDDGILVADDAREQLSALLDLGNKVAAELVLDANDLVAAFLELTEC